ncbi:MAG: hypothetical protein NTV52_24950 [Acidobacteria bacterium]|nr:hypothetical protein [Acidobacteriota bacterium]
MASNVKNVQKMRLFDRSSFCKALLFNELEGIRLFFGGRKSGFERSFGWGLGFFRVDPIEFSALAIEFAAFDDRRGGRKVFTEELQPFFVGGDAAIEFLFYPLIEAVDGRTIGDADEDVQFGIDFGELGKRMGLAIILFHEFFVPEGGEELVEGLRPPFGEGDFFDDDGFGRVTGLVFQDEVFVQAKEDLAVLIAEDGPMGRNEIA